MQIHLFTNKDNFLKIIGEVTLSKQFLLLVYFKYFSFEFYYYLK